MTRAHVVEHHDHVGALQALVAAAGLTWVSVECGAAQLVVRVTPLQTTPETAIKHLYRAMGAPPVYSVTYNRHIESGVESFCFTPVERGGR